MKIGIGIDTGGTCTDAVVYQLEEHRILAYGKTHTTKDDLSRGIVRALDKLPRDLVDQAEVIALSTTLATNACVENKGGRAKLAFFGIAQGAVAKIGEEYGLPLQDIICIQSKTKPNGDVVQEPDWQGFKSKIQERFGVCDAVALVEMYAKKSGAVLEKHARQLIKAELPIPVICGHELFTENNILKRGASALLNARLIPVIEGFLQAVKKALADREIKAPIVIVRSDGSLMTESFTATRPVETLLCGPVASVMGAVELMHRENSMIIDIGGTTTDIAFVKQGNPQRVKSGVRVGRWNTFVKGLFVDTFGLGGDSGVVVNDKKVGLEEERVIPLCMAARKYPALLAHLQKEDQAGSFITGQQKEIYLGIRGISHHPAYNELEKKVAATLHNNPLSLASLGNQLGDLVLRTHIERLIREGVIIRCGVTPTDAMHMQGDFVKYNREAAVLGISIMARTLQLTAGELCAVIYDEVKRKLHFNILRILMEDRYPILKEKGLGEQLEILIQDSYQQKKDGVGLSFLGLEFSTPATLVGVGAPTHIFLQDVGRILGTEVVSSEYSKVANALGAVIGRVAVTVSMGVRYDSEHNSHIVFGGGERHLVEDLEEAKRLADTIAAQKAAAEAVDRGAENPDVRLENEENIVTTEFGGTLYMGYTVTATATGSLRLIS